jgi:signal transduction histidine kinase/CHASE3 domain sensor protein
MDMPSPYDNKMVSRVASHAIMQADRGTVPAHQSIKKRVRVSFVIVMIAVFSLICTAFFTQDSGKRYYNDLIDQHIRSVTLIRELELSLETMVANDRAYILTGDGRHWDDAKTGRAMFVRNLIELKTHISRESSISILDKIDLLAAEHFAAVRNTVALREMGSPMKDIVTIFENEVEPRRAFVSAVLKEISSLEVSSFNEAKAEVMRNDFRIIVIQSVAAFLTIGIAVLLFIALFRTIRLNDEIEASLRVSEELSKQAIRITNMGTFDHDYATGRLNASQQMRDIGGWSENEPCSIAAFAKLIHENDRERFDHDTTLATNPNGNGILDIELRIFPQGQTSFRWIKLKSQTFFNGEDGNRFPIRTIGSVVDVTPEREREAALSDAKALIEKVIHVSPVIITIYNLTQHRTQFVSGQILNVLGYDPAEFQSYDHIVSKMGHPDDVPAIMSFIEQFKSLPFGETSSVTFRFQHNDGSFRQLLSHGSAFKQDENGNVTEIITTTTDVTTIKQMEMSLREALRDLAKEKFKLERSNQELEQFASVAAHDLRSPLNSMSGWADMLDILVPKPREPKIDQAINHIQSSSRRAGALINDLLHLASINAAISQMEPIELNQTIEDVLTVLRRDLNEADAEIRCENLPTIIGSSTHLEAVFSNLIRNALTYREKSRRLIIQIGSQTYPDHFEFFVQDNGIGIESQYTERVFEMFKRLHSDKEYPGTGIGLAHCKKVVELKGGKIWVESVFGEGSIFRFTYPRNNESMT